MGRLFLTNNRVLAQLGREENEHKGFQLNQYIDDGQVVAAAFFKKKIKAENTFIGQDGFCACSGALIYKNSTGREALKGILCDFDFDIDKIRKNIFGNYALAIKKDEKLAVFTDKYQTYHLFYAFRKEQFAISSDIMTVAYLMGYGDIDEYGLLQEAFQCGPISNGTFIEGIYRLQGYSCFLYDYSSGMFHIQKVPYKRGHYRYKSLDDAARSVADVVCKGYGRIARSYQTVAVNMTGGLDSRTVLAGCLKAGIMPVLLHAQSNNRAVVGTEEGDCHCVAELAKQQGLKVVSLNWDADYLEEMSNWDALFEKYGFDYLFYAGNRNFFRSYEKLDIEKYPDFMETGLFGEALRIREAYNHRIENFGSIFDFVNEYQMHGTNSGYLADRQFYPKSDKIIKFISEEYAKELFRYGMNGNGMIGLDQFEEVRYIQARYSDSILLNFLNQYTNVISVLSTEQVVETIFDIPKEYRAFGSVQLKVIDMLEENLLEVPVFSHCRECLLDRANYRLIRRKEFHEKGGAVLRNLGLRNTRLYEFLRKSKNAVFKDTQKVKKFNQFEQEKTKILPELIEIINKEQKVIGKTYVNTSKVPENDSIVHLMYFAMLLKGGNVMKQKRSQYFAKEV